MNIIVTGASKGIGRALCKELSNAPGSVVFAISRDLSQLNKLQQECREGSLISIACDLTDQEQLEAVIGKIKGKASQIDIVVNNAGTLINKPFEQTTSEDFLEVFSVNLFSVVAMIQAVLPMMSSRGHIVNISSVGGVQGSVKFPGLTAYSASKAALINLTESLAVELKGRGVHVNALALGAVQTSMLEKAFPKYKAPILPEQIAGFIADFAMRGHLYCNGKVIPVSLSTP